MKKSPAMAHKEQSKEIIFDQAKAISHFPVAKRPFRELKVVVHILPLVHLGIEL